MYVTVCKKVVFVSQTFIIIADFSYTTLTERILMNRTVNNIVYIAVLLLCNNIQASDVNVKRQQFGSIRSAIVSKSSEEFEKTYASILKQLSCNDISRLQGDVRMQIKALCIAKEITQNRRLYDCLSIIMQEFISDRYSLDEYIEKAEISPHIKGDKDYERALELLAKSKLPSGKQILAVRKKIVTLPEDEARTFLSEEKHRLESIGAILQQEISKAEITSCSGV